MAPGGTVQRSCFAEWHVAADDLLGRVEVFAGGCCNLAAHVPLTGY